MADEESFFRLMDACAGVVKEDGALAAVVAACLPGDVLEAMLAQFCPVEDYSELMACVEQEAVLRGARLDHVEVVRSHANKLRQSRHPLGAMPLYLTQIENEIPQFVPEYHSRGYSVITPYGADPVRTLPFEAKRIRVSELADPGNLRRVQTAVERWQFEARDFSIEEPLMVEDLSSEFLLRLDLDCLHNANAGEIRGEIIRPQRGMALLFSAASYGGAYPNGLGGAYGRVAAWQSMAGLVNAPRDEEIQLVADRAEQCQWLYFEASSEWFYQVCWDFGLVVIRPDRKSLAVIAATDTD